MKIIKITLIELLSLFIISFNITVGGDIKGKVKAIGAKHSGNAVIYIDTIPGMKFKPPKEPVQMDQRNLTFIPHVLPVLAGTEVEFLNNDDVLHNVYTTNECAEKFNLGTWPKGEIRSYKFKKPGCNAVMLCNLHPEMEAFVVILKTPYFARSAKDGSYTIKDVPAGKHTILIWHERLKGDSVTIEVPEKGEVIVNFDIKK